MSPTSFETGETTEPQAEQSPPVPQIVPTPGRIVLYTLSQKDADAINRRRNDAHTCGLPKQYRNNTGFVKHVGNPADEGDVVPMIIVRVWGDTPGAAVNGQAFVDGNDMLWVTSVSCGEGPGTWAWPKR